jgi:hypothetical protein
LPSRHCPLDATRRTSAVLQTAERPLKPFREIAARNCLTKQTESFVDSFLQFHEKLDVFVLLMATPCGYFRPPTKDLCGQAVLEPAATKYCHALLQPAAGFVDAWLIGVIQGVICDAP